MKNQIKIAVLTLLLILTVISSVVQAQTSNALPTLRGEDAVKKLKENGQYDSLMEALRHARRQNAPEAFLQSARLTASDGVPGDVFGISVSISGDTAIVGAWNDDFGKGSAYVFVRSGTTWTEQQKLTASDRGFDDNFGISVSISGDTAIISAPGDNSRGTPTQGAAYVFVRSGTTWTEQQKLTAADGGFDDRFGSSVSISGDTAIVGVASDDVGANPNQGSVYVFIRSGTTWTLQQKIMASDGAEDDRFGTSVSISGDTAIIGAPNDGVGANRNQGSAYVFVRSGTSWSEQQKLTAADGAADDLFGTSVSVSGDTAIVGAFNDDVEANINQGSAYVFIRSGTVWTLQQKLTASDGAASDYFGWSVSISGDTAIIGAIQDDVGANSDQGSAYVFIRSGTSWSEQQKLTAADGVTGGIFGRSVSISGDKIIVGAADAAFIFVNQSPTAASVSISGRVLMPSGLGLKNAAVSLTLANGEVVQRRSTSLGYYRFNDIAAGQTVIISVSSKRYTFAPQVIQVNEELTELNLTAQPQL